MSDDSRGMFFVYQPRVGPPVDEITIWFNGGPGKHLRLGLLIEMCVLTLKPGCSSLEGFLQENGRIQWAWGQYSPGINPYSWVNLTNMLWVEYPIGVGFSRGEPTATNEEEPAAEFIEFFRNFQVRLRQVCQMTRLADRAWQTIFNISDYKIYVTGESYAGRYVPYV